MAEVEETRRRIMDAAVRRVAHRSLAALTMDDVAHDAGVSRATVYRYFPGGRDQVVSEVVTAEVGRFFERITSAVADAPDFATRLERGLMAAHDALARHAVLQQVLHTEAERLVPALAPTMPIVHTLLRDDFAEHLRREHVRAGIDVDQAADLLARSVLSYLGTPGLWDLGDPGEVRRLVRDQLLAGVVAPASSR